MRRTLQVILVVLILFMAAAIPGIGFIRSEPDNYEPRWRHRVYAQSHGYEWGPCIVCRTPYGGHEIDNDLNSVIPDEKGEGFFNPVCPLCSEVVEELRERGEKVTPQSVLEIRNASD